MKWILIVSFVITLSAHAQNECWLKLDKDSIQVYTCPVANSKFKAVKTTFNVNSSLSQLASCGH